MQQRADRPRASASPHRDDDLETRLPEQVSFGPPGPQLGERADGDEVGGLIATPVVSVGSDGPRLSVTRCGGRPPNG
jgi:hypothetical protein